MRCMPSFVSTVLSDDGWREVKLAMTSHERWRTKAARASESQESEMNARTYVRMDLYSDADAVDAGGSFMSHTCCVDHVRNDKSSCGR